MKDWIELTQEEKDSFVQAMNNVPPGPTFFNLKSDREDCPSQFAEMSRADVIVAAENAAKRYY